MTEHDRNNLNFMLSLTDEQLREWFDGITVDDSHYALQLLQDATAEIIVLGLERNYDPVDDVSQANGILQQFRLSK